MALEDLTGSDKFISALNPAWPVDDDWVDEGDNHVRGIKNVLKNTFPNVDGAVTLSDEQLNTAVKAAPDSRIINGNFAIDQRNAGAAVNISAGVGANLYPVDRWSCQGSGVGAYSAGRVVGVSADEYYLRFVVGTADVPLAASYYMTQQNIEGVNIAGLKFGSAEAQGFTFAATISSPQAGTFPISFRNGTVDRSYVTTFTLAPNVPTNVVVNVPGPTAGNWGVANSAGLLVGITFGASANLQTPAINSWQSGNFIIAAGCTNMMATVGREMYIKEARLYPGSIDYGPCQRLYADELRLCQRYFQKSYDADVVPGTITNVGGLAFFAIQGAIQGNAVNLQYPVQMRAPPSFQIYSPVTGAAGVWRNNNGGADIAMTALAAAGTNSVVFMNNAGVTAGQLIFGHWALSAEL